MIDNVGAGPRAGPYGPAKFKKTKKRDQHEHSFRKTKRISLPLYRELL